MKTLYTILGKIHYEDSLRDVQTNRLHRICRWLRAPANILFLIALPLILYLSIMSHRVYPFSTVQLKQIYSTVNNEPVGCRIPTQNMYDPTLMSLLPNISRPKCLSGSTLEPKGIIFDTERDNHLILIQDPLIYGWTNCCFSQVYRDDYTQPGTTDPDNAESIGSKCYEINSNRTKVPSSMEFIAIKCTNLNHTHTKNSSMPKTAFVDVLAFTPLKPEVEERIAAFDKQNPTNELKDDDRVNLVILWVDSVSHMSFKRSMPTVLDYLEKNLSAIGLNGYNKVGEHTLSNFGASMMSLNLMTEERKCYSTFYDNCPFIWKNFSENGYRTALGEDCPQPSKWSFLAKRFKKPPVDYYLRPASRFADNHIAHNRGVGVIGSRIAQCYGPRLPGHFLLNYMETLAQRMGKDKRYFQLILSSCLAHEMLDQGKWGEPFILSTLKWFNNGGYLNQTVFVLMSDHGNRDKTLLDKTTQGSLQEKIPFMYFIFPQWFKQKYKLAVGNLIGNRDRLTSPFDAYQTFLDILFLKNIQERTLIERQKALVKLRETIPRGISWFLPIPKFRTCELAGIADAWCACKKL